MLDSMTFWGTDLAGFIAKLKARGIADDLRRAPDGATAPGTWQLFFLNPNGARIEIDFAAEEILA
jgi:hypothetical protein